MSDGDLRAENERRSVTLAEIDAQRAKGWPDFHPEDYCHRCGARNLDSWAVPPDRWREAGIDGRWQEIICPQCFDALWSRATGRRVTWWLADLAEVEAARDAALAGERDARALALDEVRRRIVNTVDPLQSGFACKRRMLDILTEAALSPTPPDTAGGGTT